MTSYHGQSFLEVSDYSKDEITDLLRHAQNVKNKLSDQPDYALQPSGKSLALLFFEPSTRTRTSFEMAAFRMGLRTINLEAGRSSTTKGETIFDTAQTIEANRPSAIVIRHYGSGVPFQISQHIKIPVINAGDGFHAHPTQALLDLFTIQQKKGEDIKGLRVLIVGDIAHSRVTRSNVKLLKMFGAEVEVCAPPTLIPPCTEEWGVKVTDNLDQALGRADVVMALRMQLERQRSYQVPSLGEYTSRFGITTERLSLINEEAVIMHPGPVNRGIEMTSAVIRDPRCVILNQVNNGMVVRAALLSRILGIEI